MLNAFLEIIGEVVVCQQEEVRVRSNAFSEGKGFRVEVKFLEMASVSGCVYLNSFFLNFDLLNIEDGSLRVMIKTQNLVFDILLHRDIIFLDVDFELLVQKLILGVAKIAMRFVRRIKFF